MTEFGDSGESGYAALIGDVVASRRQADRAGLQRRLRTELETLERRFDFALAARLVIVRGDEIQGLLRDPGIAVHVAVHLREALHPTRIAWGLGFGPLTTALAASPIETDGPCFHHAREALASSRDRDVWLSARGFDPALDETVTAIFGLLEAVRRRWTARQTEIVRLARRRMQKEVAAELEISPSVVSESLKAAAFTEVRSAEEVASRMLSAAPETGSAADSPDAPLAVRSEG